MPTNLDGVADGHAGHNATNIAEPAAVATLGPLDEAVETLRKADELATALAVLVGDPVLADLTSQHERLDAIIADLRLVASRAYDEALADRHTIRTVVAELDETRSALGDAESEVGELARRNLELEQRLAAWVDTIGAPPRRGRHDGDDPRDPAPDRGSDGLGLDARVARLTDDRNVAELLPYASGALRGIIRDLAQYAREHASVDELVADRVEAIIRRESLAKPSTSAPPAAEAMAPPLAGTASFADVAAHAPADDLDARVYNLAAGQTLATGPLLTHPAAARAIRDLARYTWQHAHAAGAPHPSFGRVVDEDGR